MATESRLFIDWLLRIDPEPAFSLDGLLERFAVDVLGRVPALASSYAQANRLVRWRDILRMDSAFSSSGAAPVLFDIDPSARTARYLARSPVNGVISKERTLRSLARPAVLRAFDALGSREYEALACVAAECAGADRTHLTPPGNEGGIDFFALIKNPGRCHVFSEARSPIRVIGQCKKYASSVQVEKVRQFVQSIHSVCHQSLLVEKHVPAWFRSSTGPVVGWMIGHSGFQSGAETLARNHGIVISDTLDVAEVCVQSRLFPMPSPGVDLPGLIRAKIAEKLK